MEQAHHAPYTLAAAGAATWGAWAEGAFLLFLFSLGHALEHFAMEKARKSIAALADLAPPTALMKRNYETVEVGIEELKIGDLVVVKPNTKIAADGIVVKGESAVNQAPITGESVPVDKFPTADPGKEFKDLSAVPAEQSSLFRRNKWRRRVGNRSAERNQRQHPFPPDNFGEGS